MPLSGAPGTAPHPSLPARPPVAGAGAGSSAAPAAAAAAGANPPRLGFSRTFASTNTSASTSGSTPTAQSTYSSYYSNSKYPQQAPAQGASYGPSMPPGYGPSSYGPQVPAEAPVSYGPQVMPAPVSYGPQAPAAGASYGRGGGGGYRSNNNNNNNSTWKQGGAAGAAGYQDGQSTYGPSYSQNYPTPQFAGYGPAYPEDPATAAATAAAATAAAASGAAASAGASARTDGRTDKDNKKKQTVYRAGGGKQWTDDTLLEWDPSHLRLFVGNLAGEVTDETLLKAFSRWKSVAKALVKRDKWTQKSRGYGFVSFSDPDDFFQAAKEMNGKYIGSHPVVVRKSKTEIKVSTFKDETRKRKNNNNKKNKEEGQNAAVAGSGVGSTAPRRDDAAATRVHSSGVQKKTKNGLKLLG